MIILVEQLKQGYLFRDRPKVSTRANGEINGEKIVCGC
jgi:hypothetical protein